MAKFRVRKAFKNIPRSAWTRTVEGKSFASVSAKERREDVRWNKGIGTREGTPVYIKSIVQVKRKRRSSRGLIYGGGY